MTSRKPGNRRERRDTERADQAAGSGGLAGRDATIDTNPNLGGPGEDTAVLGAVGPAHAADDDPDGSGDDDLDTDRDDSDYGDGGSEMDQAPATATGMSNAELIAYRRSHPLVSAQEFDDQAHEDLLCQRRASAQVHWRNTVPWLFQDAPTTTLTVPGVVAWTSDRITDARARRRLTLCQAPSLLLVGGTGTGKTHAVWWTIGHLAKAGVLTDWEVVNSVNIYQSLRPETGVNTAERLRRFCRVPLLVIDDAGAAQTSSFTHEIDYSIINYRYEYGLPIIMTTNLAPERDDTGPKPVPSLEDRMSVRVYSRLAKMVAGHTFSLGLGDRRFGEDPHGGARS